MPLYKALKATSPAESMAACLVAEADETGWRKGLLSLRAMHSDQREFWLRIGETAIAHMPYLRKTTLVSVRADSREV